VGARRERDRHHDEGRARRAARQAAAPYSCTDRRELPVEIEDIGKRIAAHYDKLRKCEDKAEQHKIAIGQLLAQVQQTCDEGGFEAFHQRFVPQLGRSRAYELLQIGSGKKTVEEVRTATRERVARHREKDRCAPPPEPSVTVTDEAAADEVTPRPDIEAQEEDTEPRGWSIRCYRKDGRVDRRLEHFKKVIGVICSGGQIAAGEVPFPPNLTPEMVAFALEEVEDAIKGLHKVKARLKAYTIQTTKDAAPDKAPPISQWRKLDIDDLEAAIVQEQRRSADIPGGITPAEWRRLDRARERAKELTASAAAASANDLRIPPFLDRTREEAR